MRSWSLANATDYQPNWGTLNFKNCCLHPQSEIGYHNNSAWEPQKSFATVWQASLPQFSALKFCNTEQTFTLASLIVSYHVGPWSPGGGYSAENGYSYVPHVPPLRPLFHTLFPKTTISEFFSSSGSYIRLKSQISEKLHFKASKLKKSSVLMPNIWSSFSFKSLKVDKKSDPELGGSSFFWPFGPHTHIKMKVKSVPPTHRPARGRPVML